MYPNTQHPVGSIDSHEINHIQLTQSFKQPHNTIATQTKISPTHQSLKSPHKPTPQPSPIYNRPPIHQTHQNYTSNCNSHTNHILKQRYTVSSLSPYKYMTVLAVATTFNPVSISHEQLQLHPKFKPTIKPDPHKCVQTQSTQHPESARTTSYKPNSNPASHPSTPPKGNAHPRKLHTVVPHRKATPNLVPPRPNHLYYINLHHVALAWQTHNTIPGEYANPPNQPTSVQAPRSIKFNLPQSQNQNTYQTHIQQQFITSPGSFARKPKNLPKSDNASLQQPQVQLKAQTQVHTKTAQTPTETPKLQDNHQFNANTRSNSVEHQHPPNITAVKYEYTKRNKTLLSSATNHTSNRAVKSHPQNTPNGSRAQLNSIRNKKPATKLTIENNHIPNPSSTSIPLETTIFKANTHVAPTASHPQKYLYTTNQSCKQIKSNVAPFNCKNKPNIDYSVSTPPNTRQQQLTAHQITQVDQYSTTSHNNQLKQKPASPILNLNPVNGSIKSTASKH
eukprot:gene2635-1633_t